MAKKKPLVNWKISGAKLDSITETKHETSKAVQRTGEFLKAETEKINTQAEKVVNL